MPITFPSKASASIVTNQNLMVAITAESNALAVATVANWLSVTAWRRALVPVGQRQAATERAQYEAVEAFDLELWCDAATTLTTPLLYGARLAPQVLADDNVDTVDTTDNEFDIASHVYLTGDGPVQITTSGVLPTGITALTNYWIRVVNSGSISLHTSLADAVSNTAEVDITGAGSGTHTVVDVQSSANADNDTQRLHFFLYGGLNNSSTITLAAQTAYIERIEHSPLTLYYAINASTSATETVTCRLSPVQRVEW